MIEFDLQLFADDSDDAAAQVDEEVQVGETVDAEEPKETIPDELAGLPEDIARETMAEANGEEPQENGEGETETADADSDNKQYSDVPNQRIPYNRFKAEVDKKKELEARNKELEEQLKSFQSQQNQQQVQPRPQQQYQMQQIQTPKQPQPQQPRFTADVVAQINEVAKQQALQMTGLSNDDLESFEYMEDDDPRKGQYQAALDMAKMNVYAGIQQAQQQRMANAQRMLEIHNAAVDDYNTFAQEQMNESDFSDVSAYAIGDFFENGISKAEQPAIFAAYQRIERNVASPEDIALIKRYYKDAKASYRKNHPAAAKRNNNPMNKVKQASKFPRSQQVEGSNDVGGAVTADTLEKMLNEEDWDNIPPEYQKMLLGVTTTVK